LGASSGEEGGLSRRVGGLLPGAFLAGGNRKCWAPTLSISPPL